MTNSKNHRISVRIVGLLILISASLVLSSCAAPTVELQTAALKRVTTKGLSIGLDLLVNNPNSQSIPLQAVDWDLDLFNADFTNGRAVLNRTLPANRSTRVDVPLGVRFSDAAIGVQKFMGGMNIPWKVAGKVHFRTPAGPVFVGFSKNGSWQNPLRSSR